MQNTEKESLRINFCKMTATTEIKTKRKRNQQNQFSWFYNPLFFKTT